MKEEKSETAVNDCLRKLKRIGIKSDVRGDLVRLTISESFPFPPLDIRDWGILDVEYDSVKEAYLPSRDYLKRIVKEKWDNFPWNYSNLYDSMVRILKDEGFFIYYADKEE